MIGGRVNSVAYEKWPLPAVDGIPHPAFRALRQTRLDSFLADSQDDGVMVVDVAGYIIDCNLSFSRRTGFARRDVIGRTIVDVVVPQHRRRVQAALDDVRAADGVRVRAAGTKRTGETCDLAMTFIPLFDDERAVVGSLAITQNLSDAAEASRDRERHSALLALAGRVAGLVGFSLDLDSGRFAWSGTLSGTTPHLPVSVDQLSSAVSATDAARWARALQRSARERRLLDVTLAVMTPTGERHLRFVGEPAPGLGASRGTVSGAVHDVTDSVLEQRSRREVEELLSTTVNSMTDGLGIVDAEWRFTFVNDRLVEMIGGDRDSLIGTTVWNSVPEISGTELEIGFREAVATGTTVHVRDRVEARDAWIEAIAYPTGGGLAVHLRDITENELAELRYRRAQEELATLGRLLDISRDAIVVRDTHHQIRYANAGAIELYGWQGIQFLGADARELVGIDGQQMERAMRTTVTDGYWSGRVPVRTADSREIVVASRWQLMRDDNGEPESVLSVSVDVTDDVAREESLRRTERLESLGTFAGGIAHDLNNVLTPILMSSQLLGHTLDGTPDREVVTMIETAARRGADMVRQVLAFTRGIESRSESIDLGSLLDELRALVRASIPEQIDLIVSRPATAVSFAGDATQLLQVLANLVSNASDAIDGAGTITIDARVETSSASDGDDVVIDVIDTGHGIDPDVMSRLWEPFFTTKPVGSGTGLGLPMAAAMIRSHGGVIEAHSDGETGSRFTVRLPLVAASEATSFARELDDVAAPRGAGQLVLVVDDEPDIRSIVRHALAANGYGVMVAANGEDAWRLIDLLDTPPDLLLSDVTMPDGNGIDLAERLIDAGSTVPIVLMSGLEDRATMSARVAQHARGFLVKPLSTPTLLTTVHEALTRTLTNGDHS